MCTHTDTYHASWTCSSPPIVFQRCFCKGIKNATFQLVQNFSYQQLVQLVHNQWNFRGPKKVPSNLDPFKPPTWEVKSQVATGLVWMFSRKKKNLHLKFELEDIPRMQVMQVHLGTNCQLGKSHLFHHGLRSALRHDSACLLSEEEHGKLPMDNKQLHSHRDSVCMLWKCMKMSGLQVLLPSFW